MRSETVEVRREELYEQVWSEPVIKAAQKFGITGTALSKICRKAAIPVPPVGYWQRLQHGHKPDRPPLPPSKDGAKSPIAIEKRPRRPYQSPEVKDRLASEEDERNRIHVAERLTRPHPLVRITVDMLRGQKPDQHGMLSRPWKARCLDIRVSRANLPRALRTMDAIIKAAEARGFGVSVTEGEGAGTHIELAGERVEIALEEKTKREEHVPTKEESERKAKYGWSSAPRWDYEPSGLLQFRIKEFTGNGARKTWSDGRKRVEEALNDVLGGIIVVAEAKRQHRIELERQRQEWAEAERRRLEFEQRRREQAEQLKTLENEAALWARSQQLRTYIDAVESGAQGRGASAEPGSKLHRWLQWARKQADRLDPLTVESASASASTGHGEASGATGAAEP
jgi:hypothetical protein